MVRGFLEITVALFVTPTCSKGFLLVPVAAWFLALSGATGLSFTDMYP